MRFSTVTFCALLVGLLVGLPAFSNSDVLTQHNDPARTGAQLSESSLRPNNVTPTTFGRLYERHVDGQVIVQPLYVSGLTIPGLGVRNVVYVATRKNLAISGFAPKGNVRTRPFHGVFRV
jgi:hypothetical protein